jgi:cyclopropane-fatty-acyl-phospholipid synthase
MFRNSAWPSHGSPSGATGEGNGIAGRFIGSFSWEAPIMSRTSPADLGRRPTACNCPASGSERPGLFSRPETSGTRPGMPSGAVSPPPRGRVYAAERALVKRMLAALGGPPVRLALWNGEEIGPSRPIARIVIRDRATLWKLVLHPKLEFGEAYSSGRLEVDGDLLEMMTALQRSIGAMGKRAGMGVRLLAWLANTLHSNTMAGSKEHIQHHYDIGNDFYRLWLDEEMAYTCAYFPTPSATLEEAQRAKFDHVCRKLWLRPGETVAEAGCGWGALALHMARHYGVSVKAYNISREQIVYARRRANSEGLASRVEFVEDDYRNIAGRFDAFVSVGMLEHVGPNHYHELGETIDRVLAGDGRGLVHSIGQNSSGYPINPWIRKRIFPGAYPPGLREMVALLEPWSLSVLDVENLRLHYAETLRQWLARFDAVEDRVAQMFDPTFVRMWRVYLAGSAAAFLAGELQLFQVTFARPRLNEIPWTRAGLYQQ